jgi:hypothetical protein
MLKKTPASMACLPPKGSAQIGMEELLGSVRDNYSLEGGGAFAAH